MRTFLLDFHPLLNSEVQQTISYYNAKSKGLGSKFYIDLKDGYQKLKTNPFYQIRYDNTRCLPLSKFPYMIHFSIDESQNRVFIEAIFNTSQNPDDNWGTRF